MLLDGITVSQQRAWRVLLAVTRCGSWGAVMPDGEGKDTVLVLDQLGGIHPEGLCQQGKRFVGIATLVPSCPT